MEQQSVSRLEIIKDLESVIEEIRSGKYSSVALLQSITVSERSINPGISESYQSGKQVTIILAAGNNNGN